MNETNSLQTKAMAYLWLQLFY